jgi:hypothetical protein
MCNHKTTENQPTSTFLFGLPRFGFFLVAEAVDAVRTFDADVIVVAPCLDLLFGSHTVFSLLSLTSELTTHLLVECAQQRIFPGFVP